MIINCKEIAKEIKDKAIKKIGILRENPYFIDKHLAIVHLVSNNDGELPNESYIKSIQRTFSEAGIRTKVYKVNTRTNYVELYELGNYLRELQVPTVVVSNDSLERSLFEACIPREYILDSAKYGRFGHPCVVEAANRVLLHTGFKEGTITVLGRGENVGKPMVEMLLNLWNGATINSCNSKTRNIRRYTEKSDVIISCVGKPKLVTRAMVEPETLVIDVGYSSANGKMVGDCEEALANYCTVTPVQGGIGLITRAILLERFVKTVKPHE